MRALRGGEAMTEAEWLASKDPEKMLLAIRDSVSERKMRLFALACCRRIWDRITDPRCRAAVEFAERFVEVGVTRRKGRPAVVKAARQACREADDAGYHSQNRPDHPARMIDVNAFHAALATVEGSAWFAAHLACGFSANTVGWEWIRDNQTEPFDWNPAAKEAEFRRQIPLLRDIFGDPFHPPRPVSSMTLAWDNGTVLKLAQSIYDERAFDRMPILADALEDAGCGDADILRHCREPGEHVRGCWVIDLLLGKE
jgi:hypothetical protein